MRRKLNRHATCIPTAAAHLTRIAAEGNDILLAPLELRSNVGDTPEIAVLRGCDLLPVQEHVAYRHQSLELDQHLPALPRFLGREALAVPTLHEAFETDRPLGLLVPRQLEFVVVRRIDPAPARVVKRRLRVFLSRLCVALRPEPPAAVPVPLDAVDRAERQHPSILRLRSARARISDCAHRRYSCDCKRQHFPCIHFHPPCLILS